MGTVFNKAQSPLTPIYWSCGFVVQQRAYNKLYNESTPNSKA